LVENSKIESILWRYRCLTYDRKTICCSIFCTFADYLIPEGKENFFMKIGDKYYRSLWIDESDPGIIRVIDQEKLPFIFEIKELCSVEDIFTSIKNMNVRGAPLIGVAGAFGMYLATLEITQHTNVYDHLNNAARYLISSRPTAVNLSWAVNKVLNKLTVCSYVQALSGIALSAAIDICEAEINSCIQIGQYGIKIIEEISKKKKGGTVNILTHCNAGWLACVDYGTVTAPIYLAHERGIPLHVWVDETRPKNQGAKLTAYELGNEGIPYTLIADNTGGYLMQRGLVDVVISGSDRTTATGDVANKIGTYLKALGARDNNIPFYVALPSSSIDLSISDGLNEISIEKRDPDEVTSVSGYADGKIMSVRICPEDTKAINYGFDITPARLVTALITEKGICKATEEDIRKLFSDKVN
jgi:methylthioribose-1-phosphate isomerase